MTRSLGLDFGDRRIGVALSDPSGILATPLTVLIRSEESADLEAILDIARQHQVERIVVGLPRSMDGSLGKQARKVQVFIQRLGQHAGVPVEPWDERLSTVAAEQMMSDAGIKRALRKVRRDAAAAAVILQGYLDGAQVSGS